MAGENPARILSKRNFEKYQGKWIAVSSWRKVNQIITSGETLEDIQKKMSGKGHYNAVIFFVEDERVQ